MAEGSKIASGSDDRTIIIWDAATGEQKTRLKGHTSKVWSVAWSPEGSKIVSGVGGDQALPGDIFIWDAVTGQQKAQLKGHTSFVISVAWSPEGSKIASASEDSTVIIWDAVTGKPKSQLKGHSGGVNSVTWCGVGSNVVSGSSDKTVIIKNSETAEQISQLKGHTGAVLSVACSPEKSKIAMEAKNKTPIMSAPQAGQVAPEEKHFLGGMGLLELLNQTHLSISVKNLSKIILDSEREMRRSNVDEPQGGYTSEQLKHYLFDNQIFLLEKPEYGSLFSDEKPHVPVTYMWMGTPLRELIVILKDKFGEDALVWIDIIFNDQRKPEAVVKAVMAANGTYMTSKDHVVIFSKADYPVYSQGGHVVGNQECEPWDRCWCLLEIVLRDLAARTNKGKAPSQIVLSDRYYGMLARKFKGVSAKEAIKGMFAGKDFTQMQGRPEDVREISRMLTREIFASKEEFNKRIGEKLTEMLSSHF